jgi:hypothetical protein
MQGKWNFFLDHTNPTHFQKSAFYVDFEIVKSLASLRNDKHNLSSI